MNIKKITEMIYSPLYKSSVLPCYISNNFSAYVLATYNGKDVLGYYYHLDSVLDALLKNYPIDTECELYMYRKAIAYAKEHDFTK